MEVRAIDEDKKKSSLLGQQIINELDSWSIRVDNFRIYLNLRKVGRRETA